jgi:hypothetical protein
VKGTFLINDGIEFNLQLGDSFVPALLLQVKILPFVDNLSGIPFLLFTICYGLDIKCPQKAHMLNPCGPQVVELIGRL